MTTPTTIPTCFQCRKILGNPHTVCSKCQIAFCSEQCALNSWKDKDAPHRVYCNRLAHALAAYAESVRTYVARVSQSAAAAKEHATPTAVGMRPSESLGRRARASPLRDVTYQVQRRRARAQALAAAMSGSAVADVDTALTRADREAIRHSAQTLQFLLDVLRVGFEANFDEYLPMFAALFRALTRVQRAAVLPRLVELVPALKQHLAQASDFAEFYASYGALLSDLPSEVAIDLRFEGTLALDAEDVLEPMLRQALRLNLTNARVVVRSDGRETRITAYHRLIAACAGARARRFRIAAVVSDWSDVENLVPLPVRAYEVEHFLSPHAWKLLSLFRNVATLQLMAYTGHVSATYVLEPEFLVRLLATARVESLALELAPDPSGSPRGRLSSFRVLASIAMDRAAWRPLRHLVLVDGTATERSEEESALKRRIDAQPLATRLPIQLLRIVRSGGSAAADGQGDVRVYAMRVLDPVRVID